MKELRRIKVGEFYIDNSIGIEDVKNNPQLLEERVITIEKFFEDKEKIELDDKKLELFLNGVKLGCTNKDDIYRIYNRNKFIGLGIVEKNKLKRDIVI